jgi:hypothetical protein
MQIGSPLEAVHNALARAVHGDLPPVKYWQRDWIAFRKLPKEETAKLKANEGPGCWTESRPSNGDVRLIVFEQIWGSTALGYGGIGGAAMSPAYTVVVSHDHISCVYFGEGPLAYTIDHGKQSVKGANRWQEDLAKRNLVERSRNAIYD